MFNGMLPISLHEQKNLHHRDKRSVTYLALVFVGFWFSNIAFADPIQTQNIHSMLEAETLEGFPLFNTRVKDSLNFRTSYSSGEDLFQQFVRFIFPTNGREKRPEFLAWPAWGQKKPQYKLFKWQEFESNHFKFYSYPEGRAVLPSVIGFLEEDYEKNNKLFGVQSNFSKKIPVIFYQTRRDFEQTNIIGGPIPEGLGGVTELFSWKRAVFPFQGNYQELEHVVKHEGTHIYQIAKGTLGLPLWFIEGTAETNSIYWDSQAEMIIRDAYINGFFKHIWELWQIQGTWLMYKQGNFIVNLIHEEYGNDGIRRIYEHAGLHSFNETLKKSLGITEKELDDKVFAKLGQQYGHLLTKKDALERSRKAVKRQVLLNAHESFFVSGGASGPRNALYINHVNAVGKVTRHKVVSDRRFGSESLGYFSKGAFINEKQLAYVIKRSKTDVIRVHAYQFDVTKRQFQLGKRQEYQWEELATISDPVLVADRGIAFVGYSNGFANLYYYDFASKKLQGLTQSNRHIEGLDYSPVRNELVYSMEEEPLPGIIRYDRNLYTYNLENKLERRLMNTRTVIEETPKFSADGQKLIYVGDPDGTFDLMSYDFKTQETRRLTRMRVGARRPDWGPKDTIYFNGYEGLAPNVFFMNYPTAKEMLALDLPDGRTSVAELSGLELKVPQVLPKPKPKEPSENVEDSLRIENDSISLHFKSDQYQVLGAAHGRDRLILYAEPGEENSDEIVEDPRRRFFVWQKNQIQSLESTMVARVGLGQKLRDEIQRGLGGRPIKQAWIDASNEKVMVLVNNRLAMPSEKLYRKGNIGAYFYDIKNKTFFPLNTDHFEHLRKEKLQWVSFLEGRSMLFAFAESRTGPFEIGIYDGIKDRYKTLDDKAYEFRVSPKKNEIAWRNSDSFFHAFSHDLKPEKIAVPAWQGRGHAFTFLGDGTLIVFSATSKLWQRFSFVQGKQKDHQRINAMSGKKLLDATLNAVTGDLVLRLKRKKDFKIPEELMLWKAAQLKLETLAQFAVRYQSVDFYKDILIVQTQNNSVGIRRLWAYLDGRWNRFDSPEKVQLTKDQSILFQGKRQFFIYENAEQRFWPIAGETAGFVDDDNQIIFSSLDGSRFQLFSYLRKEKAVGPLTASDNHQVSPVKHGNQLVWSNQINGKWSLEVGSLKKPQGAEPVTLDERDITGPKKVEDKLLVDVGEQHQARFEETGIRSNESEPFFIPGHPSPNPFKLQSLTGAMAFDGSDFRFFISGFMDNLFSDQGIFVNGLFFGETQFATVGYANLKVGRNYSLQFNKRDNIRIGGVEIEQNFTLDRYREITLSANSEIHDYGLPTSSTTQIVTPDVQDQTFYVVGGGLRYGQDVTVWDLHGPISGHRFFAKVGSGMDVETQGLAHFDANVDFRLYQRFARRFGLAHRIIAGTSQGKLPSVFLLGGNFSFRGVGLDDIEGQNYWVYSGDLRIPVFDFLGAKFFDPVDRFLGIFTRYFDVRSGIYADLGSLWFNGQDDRFIHSVGFFVNTPTLFGIIFRFSKGFQGETGSNFWFGFNW